MAASDAPAKQRTMPATQRLRFTVDEDLCLLREVRAANPFASPEGWTLVYSNLLVALTRVFTIRAIRDRVDLLLGYFRQQDTANLRNRSGTEEQYAEKDRLLQEIFDLAREFGHRPKTAPRKGRSGAAACKRRPQSSAAAQVRAAKAARDAAVARTAPLPVPSVSTVDADEEPEQYASPDLGEEGSPALNLLMQAYMENPEREEEEDFVAPSQPVRSPDNAPNGAGTDENVPPTPASRSSGARRKRRQQSSEMDFLERRSEQELAREDRRFALEERDMALREMQMSLEQLKYQEDAKDRAEARQALAEERRAQAEERQFQAEERKIQMEERRAATEERRLLIAQQELQIQLLTRQIQK
ncbi:caldesmon [Ixodes scapularis]|uniref:caldesmon n=1 Tax=Ixodes scapularis TaxID=6945 RepID=UPI001A9E8ADF|nr:caldesmon [Ixodes scapularis]